MMYASIARELPTSPIREMMTRAGSIPDCISFAVGEPDFAPAESILAEAHASLDRKETHYAPGAGLPALREAYAAYLSKRTGVRYSSDQIITTAGGMASLFIGLMCLLEPGDEVLISAPYFSNYAQIVKLCRAVPVSVDVREEDDFDLTVEAVRQAITPKTKVLMINSPCNPTGGTISRRTLEGIAALAVQHDFFVLSDEVYCEILFDDEKYTSIASLPGMAERTFIVDSVSKTFAMTGFRIGFGAGPIELIRFMTKLTEGVYSAACTTSEYAAAEAFRSGLPYCAEMVKEYARRRDYLYEALNAMKGIHCVKPKGAFYIFANIAETGLDAVTFCNRALEEAHVSMVPGNNFGSAAGAHYVRIAYATSMENIAEGCKRLQAFCEAL